MVVPRRSADGATRVSRCVVYTDIGGSTELVEDLGEAQAHRLVSEHNAVVRAALSHHRGREVKTLGDGFQLVFESGGDAVACAIAIQRRLVDLRVASIARSLSVRIGVAMGPVLLEGDEVLGRTSILAQRIMSVAEPGQILVSAQVRALLETPPLARIAARGHFPLKGIRESQEIWEILWRPAEVRAPALARARFSRRGDASEVPFVGRDSELRELDERLGDATRGRSRLVAVHGEAGAGKSRLVLEFLRSIDRRRLTLAIGRCDPLVHTPFGPFLECLRDWLSAGWRPSPAIAAELRRLEPFAPELGTLPAAEAASPPALDSALGRRRLLDALATAIVERCEQRPVVLVIEDLHWADRESLDLVRVLARRALPRVVESPPRLLIVVTCREDEPGADPPTGTLLADLMRDDLVVRVPLAGLDEASVGVMLRALASVPPGSPLTALVARRSGGNALFVLELARHMIEHFAPELLADPAAVARLEVPPGIRELLGQRLSGLDEACLEVLRVAALVGSEVPLALLTDTVDTSRLDPVDALAAARRARIVEESEVSGEIRYGFAHPLLAECLADQLSLAERRRCHLAIAQALARSDQAGQAASAVQRAHHWIEAGSAAPPDELACDAERAGDLASLVFALPDAERFYRAALEAARRSAGPAATDLVELRRKLALTLGREGRVEEAMSLSDQVLAALEADGEAERAAELRVSIASILGQFVRPAEARPYLEKVVASGSDLPTVLRARALAGYAIVLDQLGENDALQRTAVRLQRLARRTSDPQLEERALNVWRNWYGNHTSDFRRTLRLTERIAAHPSVVGDPWRMALRGAELAFGQLLLGRIDAALAAAAAATATAQSCGSLAEELNARAIRALCLCLRGDWAAFEDEWSVAAPLLGRVPGFLRIGLLIWARRRADLWFQRQPERLPSPRRIYRGMGLAEAAVAATSCLVLAEMGHPDAEEKILETEAVLPGDGAGLNWFIAAQALAASWIVLGRAEPAKRWFEPLAPYRGTVYLGQTDVVRGGIARLNARWPEAAECLGRAVRSARAEGLKPCLVLALHERALAYQGRALRGDRARAARDRAEASALSAELGMPPRPEIPTEWRETDGTEPSESLRDV